eukprot:1410153-Rhodomonas_salina.1
MPSTAWRCRWAQGIGGCKCAQGIALRVHEWPESIRFRVEGSAFRVEGWVQGSGFRVQGSGFRGVSAKRCEHSLRLKEFN